MTPELGFVVFAAMGVTFVASLLMFRLGIKVGRANLSRLVEKAEHGAELRGAAWMRYDAVGELLNMHVDGIPEPRETFDEAFERVRKLDAVTVCEKGRRNEKARMSR